MRKRSFTLFVISLFTFITVAYSQDPEFSQFYANPLYLNPALAGATICPRLIGNFRDQWPSIGGAYVTYSASYDQYFDFLHGGVGLLVVADRTGGGNLNSTQFNLMYAYKFNISQHVYASTALEVGYYQRSLAWDNLTFEDMIDPQTGFTIPTSEKQPDNLSVGVPDFSAGVFVGYDEIIYGGVAVNHLSQPKIGFYTDNTTKLDMKITVHAGSIINLNGQGGISDKEFTLSPNVLYQQQFKFHQLNLGLYLTYSFLMVGGWYRFNFENADAIIPMVGIQYKSFRAGFSYDVTMSDLSSATGGAYEISAAWQFPCQEKRRTIKAIKCPRF